MRNVFYFSKKVRLFSQNDVLFLFYFLINPAGTTAIVTFLPVMNDKKIMTFLPVMNDKKVTIVTFL